MIFTIYNDNDIRDTKPRRRPRKQPNPQRHHRGSQREGTSQGCRRVAGAPPRRDLEQLRGRRTLHRLQASEEVREPQQGRGAHLGSDPAVGQRRRGQACRANCAATGGEDGRREEGPQSEECEVYTEGEGHPANEDCRGQAARGTHKAQVIAMIQRKGGATLAEIVKAKHTVRGFISILGSKGGMKVTSTRRESAGARIYEG
jgi:hypothetical protein